MNFFINHIEDTSIPSNEKVLPILSMMLIHDGRHDFHKFHEMIQNADITFSMSDVDSGVYKVANSKAFIRKTGDSCCQDEYLVCYQFTKKEVDRPGKYKGYFTIKFNDDIKNDDCEYPKGVLKAPIRDELYIIVR
jgi:hypothetical protein